MAAQLVNKLLTVIALNIATSKTKHFIVLLTRIAEWFSWKNQQSAQNAVSNLKWRKANAPPSEPNSIWWQSSPPRQIHLRPNRKQIWSLRNVVLLEMIDCNSATKQINTTSNGRRNIAELKYLPEYSAMSSKGIH